jgi:UDPglucose 6-dehydrogenase
MLIVESLTNCQPTLRHNTMNITVIGTGYVGLVTGACLAEMGNNVVCVDQDAAKIAAIDRGELPIHEPGLDAIVERNRGQGQLRFSTRLSEACAERDVFLIAVGTPPNEDGSADLQHVLEVARELGRTITDSAVIVGKSTVPVGTGDLVQNAIKTELARRNLDIPIEYVSNPEFLKEGAAVEDFMRPDRVIVGTTSASALALMREMYAPVTRNHERMIVMGVREAEMTKYAANAMLATRISFMNEIAQICDDVGVDVESVRVGIGSDTRIGYSFIYAGCGYGGSCFPKDVKALIHMATARGNPVHLLDAVEKRNELQKRLLAGKVKQRFGEDLKGRVIGVWGLAFKPGTDDMREAPAIALLEELIAAGATVRAYDPAANKMARSILPRSWFASGQLQVSDSQYATVEGADALALLTEWKPFRQPDFRRMQRIMRGHVIFDGRNQYDPHSVARHGFEYFGIGRPHTHPT